MAGRTGTASYRQHKAGKKAWGKKSRQHHAGKAAWSKAGGQGGGSGSRSEAARKAWRTRRGK